MLRTCTRLIPLALAAGLWACGGDSHGHEHGDGDHGHDHAPEDEHGEDGHDDDHDHAHVHEPLFGGALIELGDHAANVEVDLDGESGTLRIYALDAHATDVVRTKEPTITVTVDAEEPFEVTLSHVESKLSGESTGDSSTYAVTDDRLKGMDHFHGTLTTINVMGVAYNDVALAWPAGAHDHDHDEHHDEHHDGEDHDGEDH